MATAVTVISQFLVRPPPGENRVSRMSLRLTFFDMLWLHAPPVQRLLFYRLPGVTQSKFLNDVVPDIRDSLAATLNHYLPMAGNLTIPPNSDSGEPGILWTEGDSVALTVAESATDFDSLTADRTINCSDLHPLVPELKQTVSDSGTTVSSVVAVQISLFQEKGFSIGLTNHAAAGDGNTIFRFMRIWSTIARSKGRDNTMKICTNFQQREESTVEFNRATKLLPFYYRNIIEDKEGIGKTYLKQWDEIVHNNLQSGISLNTTQLRRTFSLSFNNVKTLKALSPDRSTFQVACAYTWSCLVKSRARKDHLGENRLLCFADCRARVHSMVDWNYFGNCLAVCLATGEHDDLAADEGSVEYAAGRIHAAVEPRMYREHAKMDRVDGERIRSGAKEWLAELRSVDLEKRDFMVANAPGFNFYKMRFRWGRPVKYEHVSIDKTGAFSLCGTRFYRFGGGGKERPKVEVCVCLPEDGMDAFAAVFHEGLESLKAINIPKPVIDDDDF